MSQMESLSIKVLLYTLWKQQQKTNLKQAKDMILLDRPI